MEKTISVNGTDYEIVELLGRGKGGYSYLASSCDRLAVLKQIHHEPCDFYTFGNKLESEKYAYSRLKEVGIRIPDMISVDDASEIIVKEYIAGPTIFELVRDGISVEPFIIQVRKMAELPIACQRRSFDAIGFYAVGDEVIFLDFAVCQHDGREDK